MGDVVGRNVFGVVGLGTVVRSWDMRDFPLVMLSHPQKNRKGKSRARMRGKVNSDEVESKWLKGVSSARGYIITSN